MKNHTMPPATKQPRQRVSARCRLRAGTASDFISHALTSIKPGDQVIIWCRVSRCAQKCNGNLTDQEKNLRQKAEKFGAIVVETATYIGSGTDPYWLALPAEKAKKLGAKLFAESTDRFIRHAGYHSNENPDAQARDCELQDLSRWTQGVVLVTDCHPDATPRNVRSYQRKRGQYAKGRKGGRPKIIENQRTWIDAICKLWQKLPY